MRKPDEELHTQVYSDYLVAMLVGTPLKEVARKNGCSEKLIQNIRHRKESERAYRMTSNIRKQLWENKYKHIQDMLDTKPNQGIQDALIRKLYSVHGFDIKEITKYTGKGRVYIMDCLLKVINRYPSA
jgi:hypothetical protein